MIDGRSDLGLAGADTFTTAYAHLVEDLERALWQDETGAVIDAYQTYTNACEQALADPHVQQRVTNALEDLTAALSRALERPGARAAIDEAAAAYVLEVGAAWPQLHPDEHGVEALLALATGMTTLAWLFGLGSSGLVSPFGLTSTPTFDPSSNGFGDAFTVDPGVDDDGIVWQEFGVGEDGEIVQRTAAPSSPPPRAKAPPPPPPSDDPVEQVRRALSDYEAGLKAIGIPDGPSDSPGQAADLTGAYLRLLQGTGTVPDVYASYARLVEIATELVERQVRLARGYEQLLQAALSGHRPDELQRTADERYRRLMETIRDAWARLDPATASSEQLAELAAATSRAAKLHEAASPP